MLFHNPARRSTKQVGGEPWTQKTKSRHISKTKEFPTKDSVIRGLFEEAPKTALSPKCAVSHNCGWRRRACVNS